jgi:ferritin-like metal-binding protein YciE
MHRRTVKKESAQRSSSTFPSKKTMAAVGMTTKGASGRPKASRGDAPRGRTHENQTTSTNLPKEVPKGFLNKLGEMYTAEKELALALPLVQKAAKSKDLKTVLKIHLKETKGHARVLKDVAESLGRKLPSKNCKPMTRLIGQGVKVIAKRIFSGNKDRDLIGIGQKIERFEIENYTPLVAETKRLEFTHEEALLTSILNQEKLASELLTALGHGRGPFDKLLKKVVLEHAGAGTLSTGS